MLAHAFAPKLRRGMLLAVPLLLAVLLPHAPDVHAASSSTWKSVAKRLKAAQKAGAKADYDLALARSYTLGSAAERQAAASAAKAEYKDGKALAKDQYKARLDLAKKLGETDLYRVTIDPGDFVPTVDNPLMPLTPGTTYVFESNAEDGPEHIEVSVLHETKVILGVPCVVVRDTVTVGGQVVEDTLDWFAQDKEGNVWYFGELSLSYEGGRLIGVEGSWEAGVDGALPGIIMQAAPAVGMIYRQEFLLGEAEDWAQVEALDETVTVPAGTYTGCLRTLEGTPIEPDGTENKYYAPGVGVVLEVNPETGERTELIDIITP
jgi:hypothetical protein